MAQYLNGSIGLGPGACAVRIMMQWARFEPMTKKPEGLPLCALVQLKINTLSIGRLRLMQLLHNQRIPLRLRAFARNSCAVRLACKKPTFTLYVIIAADAQIAKPAAFFGLGFC